MTGWSFLIIPSLWAITTSTTAAYEIVLHNCKIKIQIYGYFIKRNSIHISEALSMSAIGCAQDVMIYALGFQISLKQKNVHKYWTFYLLARRYLFHGTDSIYKSRLRVKPRDKEVIGIREALVWSYYVDGLILHDHTKVNALQLLSTRWKEL